MIIVFGGAFNPVTNAHLEVCDFTLSQFPNATFLFLPVSSAYTKSDLASNYDRVNMLKLAISDKEHVAISEIEISDSDYLGTYQSLIRISDAYQDDVLFVVGADNLINMHKWINIHGLLSEFKIIVLGRYGLDIHNLIMHNPVLQRHQSQFVLFPEFDMDISSTGFRESFDKSLVPEAVYDYIINNELYRGDEDVQE
ncbi:nicotinate (nicotinamide) nucleotide adenylyltransferase [Candidatus Xianfuyuplasma coldseepsis]|uniref:Probable nicotinate-nucleotide adenylyltransferase n=1 Tax=Candidatus Xianfuyuplasma coldseepsis TaxID=2782163 RepID=A0A7L7KSX3_9MOLU|nr:nicotinate (nicotinamide) nucleotide adenylyltransferase [Xianfuyuplasma coldseepsis]QMS85705.1 nicotinate (nicotinamide) nucleotide adenylyltransferase [Xianfuyuplasma coldseepsis]